MVELSDAFASLWTSLAGDLDTELQVTDANHREAALSGVAVVLLAAGGAERDAVEWLERHEMRSTPPVFVVGAETDRRVVSEVVGSGARDYFALPHDLELLRNAVSDAVNRFVHERARENDAEDSKNEAFAEIIGDSPALKAALDRATLALPHADSTVLILGETGTGKELLARAVHLAGPRRRAPFVPVNCSALPDHLIESELFGHERGAFTDAHATKPGLFEVADGGTLFLDEIATLAPEMQAKLLRVLEDKEVRRVGGTKSRTVNVRIVAATNERLEDSVTDGSFRQDLYFRLSVITLSLPPLRERHNDALLITNWFLRRLAAQHGVPVPKLSETAARALLDHHWPGNVRELRNAVERALLLSPNGELNTSELIPSRTVPRGGNGALPFPAPLDEIVTAAARSTLDLCGGNRSETARRLRVSRGRLRRLLNDESMPV